MAINVIIVKKDVHKIKLFLFSVVYSWLLKVIKGLILITELETFYVMVFDLNPSNGWQNYFGHKRWIFVDKIGEFSWTLLVNSCGHFCPQEFLFLGEFSWTFFGWILLDIFGEFSWTLFFNSNEKSYIIIKQ